MMFWRNSLKEKCIWTLSSQAIVRKGSWHQNEVPWEGAIFSRFSHLKVSTSKSWGFYSCLQLLGLSLQLDLLQNKSCLRHGYQVRHLWHGTCVGPHLRSVLSKRDQAHLVKSLGGIYQRRRLPMRIAEPQWWVTYTAQMRTLLGDATLAFPAFGRKEFIWHN